MFESVIINLIKIIYNSKSRIIFSIYLFIYFILSIYLLYILTISAMISRSTLKLSIFILNIFSYTTRNIFQSEKLKYVCRSQSESRAQQQRIAAMYTDAAFCMETTVLQSAFDSGPGFALCSLM